MVTRTAAALVVGNELLTGKIRDENTPFLARVLFELGIALRRVIVCPDEIDVIAHDLDQLRRGHDYVFTSGGVGPTHDDITLDAVAHSFGVALGRSEEMADMIAQHFGQRTTEAHLRMANVPVGARLVRTSELWWPTVAMDNVFVLPGVPIIFQKKVAALRTLLDHGARFASVCLYTACDEGEVAALLAEVAQAHPRVAVGSYLRTPGADYEVKLTFDGADPAEVASAADALCLGLAPGLLLRREG